MINNIVLVGRLTKDVELRHTQNGTAVANFTLAVNRSYKNKQGENEADFIQIVAWDKTANIVAQYTSKGSQIGIVGRIQTRHYDNDQGQRVYVTEVVANRVQLLDSKQGKPRQYSKQVFSESETVKVSDSDLPF